MSRRGITHLPGFARSLDLLLNRERYSLTDVALMFGVSHQRIRQLLDRYGIPVAQGVKTAKGLHACRVWNDERHRFEPVAKGTLRAQASAERRLLTAARNAGVVEGNRIRLTVVGLALYEHLGRTPTLVEWASVYAERPVSRNVAGSRIRAEWGGKPHASLRTIRRLVGIPQPVLGAWKRKEWAA